MKLFERISGKLTDANIYSVPRFAIMIFLLSCFLNLCSVAGLYCQESTPPQELPLAAPADVTAKNPTTAETDTNSSNQEIHDNLKSELENIKIRQEIVLESTSNSLKRALWIFGILGSVITLFSFFQTFNDSRTMKVLRGQIEESKEITGSYQRNIESITQLVGALKQVFEFQAQAQEMMQHITRLQDQQKATEEHLEKELDDINRTAMVLSRKCKRNSLNIPDFQGEARAFREKGEILAGSVNIEGQLNANCYYIFALDRRIANDYEGALEEFDTAIRLSREGIEQADTKILSLYPSLKDQASARSWLEKLQNVCFFHSAIILYNLGNYGEALRRFRSAVEYDATDCKSLTYIPEAMFLGRLSSFNAIEEEFRNVIQRFERLSAKETAHFAESREQLLAQAYIKLGNCYLGRSRDGEYNKNMNLNTTKEFFEKALQLDPGSIIVRFSYAQVLYLLNQKGKRNVESESKYGDIFRSVFTEIKTKISQIVEAKILIMYYYILAICCHYAEIENEIPQLYLMRIYELRPKLPNYEDLRIFSPLSKGDLSVGEFMKEIEEFQLQTLNQKTEDMDLLNQETRERNLSTSDLKTVQSRRRRRGW